MNILEQANPKEDRRWDALVESCRMQCGSMVTVGLGAHLVDALDSCADLEVTPCDDVSELRRFDGAEGEGGPNLPILCVVVGADIFDEDAAMRLRLVYSHFAKRPKVWIVAVTSFMPGAFDEYLCLQGASICATEDHLLRPVRQLAERASTELRHG